MAAIMYSSYCTHMLTLCCSLISDLFIYDGLRVYYSRTVLYVCSFGLFGTRVNEPKNLTLNYLSVALAIVRVFLFAFVRPSESSTAEPSVRLAIVPVALVLMFEFVFIVHSRSC